MIATLRQQLAELRFFASIIGSAVTCRGLFSSAVTVESRLPSEIGRSPLGDYATWQQKAEAQAALITDLRQQIAEAQSLPAIDEARLNKRRQRTFSS